MSSFGVIHPCCCTDWGEIWHGGGDLRYHCGPLLRAKFHPNRCNVSPLRGEKPQNRPLSKLNTAAGKQCKTEIWLLEITNRN